MFWRRKQTEDFEVSFDDTADVTDRRGAFRIGTDPLAPIEFSIDGVGYEVTNISTTGIAIKTRKLQIDGTYMARLKLSADSPAIFTRVDVISVSERGCCRCAFQQLSEHSQQALQRYILVCEREKIRNQRARGS